MNPAHPLEIRRATADDADVVQGMMARMSASTPGNFDFRATPADFEKALSGDCPALRAFLAEREGHAVGIVIFFTTFSTWYGEPGLYIQDLFIESDCRGSGIGQQLLAAASRWAIQRGATHMRLAVDTDNEGAMAFYERIGMQKRDDEMIFMIEGEGFRKMGMAG